MKTFFRDMPLKAKLLSYAGVMLSLIIMSFGYATYSLNSIGNELSTIVEEDIPLSKKISLITITQLEQAVSFERALHYGPKLKNEPAALAHFDKTLRHFEHGTEVIEQTIVQAVVLADHAQSSQDLALIAKFNEVKLSLHQIKQSHDLYVEHANEIFVLLAQGEVHAADLLVEKVEIEEEALDKKAEALLENIQLFTEASATLAKEHEEDAIVTLLIIGVVSVIIGVMFSQMLSKYIVSGINTAIVTASGDLTKEIVVTSKDEIGQLLVAMNGMKNKLTGMITDISGVTGQLSTASEEMSVVTTQTSEIITQQRCETELVATAMNQMTSTVHDVADTINQTATHALEATKQTIEGSKVVDTAVREINKLAEQIAEAAVTINELELHSDNINSVMDVIKGIAEQTNLLALNAAIEAARAGEQGRGFAVVADEVRTLAVRTQESTKEINQMIDKLQAGTRAAVLIMEQSRNQTETAVECAKKSGEAFDDISASVNNISAMCEQIAGAAEEQGAVSEEINRNIVQINDMSSQTAIGAEQTSVASRDLATMAAQLKGLVSNFAV